MHALIAVTLFGAGCVTEIEASSQAPKTAEAPPGPSVDLERARFHSRRPGWGDEDVLRLAGLSVRVTTGPGTVRSHLTMNLENPGDAQVEAVMSLPVPPGAAVTRAVLWVGERPMEGAFVARERAHAIYRSIVDRRRDPMLVAWDGPDWVSISVFPLEAKQTRRLEIEWVEPIGTAGGRRWYRVPLVADRGSVVGVAAAVSVDGKPIATQSRMWLPLGRDEGGASLVARQPGDPWSHVLIAGEGAASAAGGAPGIVVVAETSAAMSSRDRWRQRDVLAEGLRRLPAGARVTLMAADWDIAALAERADLGAAKKALDALDALPSAGALDLERVLLRAAARAEADGARAIVFVGRGEDAFPGDGLRASLARLRASGIALVAVGTPRVSAPLADVAALSGGRSLDGGGDLGGALRGARWLAARPPAEAVAGVGRWHPLETVTGGTAWLASLMGPAPRAAVRALPQDLGALSVRARLGWRGDREPGATIAQQVLAPLTSILVLETEADYRRFGLEVPEPMETARPAGRWSRRKAEENPRSAGILGVLKTEGDPIASIFGRDSSLGGDAENPLGAALIGTETGEAFGVGGLALQGTGAGGGGTREGTITVGAIGSTSHGRGAGSQALDAHRSSRPDVMAGQAIVRGSLDKEIIRRIIRRHVNEVRYCYEQELPRDPALAGRITLRFTIGETGDVLTSALQSSTMGNLRVERCVERAARRWIFPKTLGGGLAIVSYPFVFTQGEGARQETRLGRIGRPGPTWSSASTWKQALAILAEKTPLEERLARIAEFAGVADTSRADALAWSIVTTSPRRFTSFDEALLAASLLRLGGGERDARRLLVELAPESAPLVANELGRWGAAVDAARVRELAARR